MNTWTGDIRLRPTRIGFLANPTDVKSIRMIMRHCSCLWGGAFNPIIPASARSPEAWQPTKRWQWRPSGWELAKRYIRFFEPDLFVDVTKNAAKKLSLVEAGSLGSAANSVILWDDFVEKDDSAFSAFTVGQDVFDLYRHLYKTEFQFVFRTKPLVGIFEEAKNQGGAAFFETVFGCFPHTPNLKFFRDTYLDVFQPTAFAPSVEAFTEIWKKYSGPLKIGVDGLELDRSGSGDPVIFVFDPNLGTDLIDFWNLRLFSPSVTPINVHWIKECEQIITRTIAENHRHIRHHPQGLKHRTTIEFASSISEEQARSLVTNHVKGIPKDSLSVKLFYSSIWDISKEDWYVKPTPISVTADERDVEIRTETGSDYAWIDSLTPKFVDRFGGQARWANVVRIRSPITEGENKAFCEPQEDIPKAKDLIHDSKFSKEGLVTLVEFPHFRTLLKFQNADSRICNWLGEKGITAVHSDAGRTAKHVIDALGGLRGVRLIADEETVQELNRMAASRVVYEDGERATVVDENPPRTSAHQSWLRIEKARKKSTWNSASIDDLTTAHVMQIGLSLACSFCSAKNWFGLNELDYEVQCQRCLKKFPFPQAEAGHKWFYRPLGAFAVPDYAKGAYATALTLRLLSGRSTGAAIDRQFAYSTGLDLTLGGRKREIDFVAWHRNSRTMALSSETIVIFGEAKSFASEAIKEKDCELLQDLGRRFPGAFLVAAVMKRELSKHERKLLSTLATWGRVPGTDGMPRSSVIVLTGTELFADGDLPEVWKDIGGAYEKALNTHVGGVFNLWKLSDCTQQIYLGLEPYSVWREKRFEKQQRRRTIN